MKHIYRILILLLICGSCQQKNDLDFKSLESLCQINDSSNVILRLDLERSVASNPLKFSKGILTLSNDFDFLYSQLNRNERKDYNDSLNISWNQLTHKLNVDYINNGVLGSSRFSWLISDIDNDIKTKVNRRLVYYKVKNLEFEINRYLFYQHSYSNISVNKIEPTVIKFKDTAYLILNGYDSLYRPKVLSNSYFDKNFTPNNNFYIKRDKRYNLYDLQTVTKIPISEFDKMNLEIYYLMNVGYPEKIQYKLKVINLR